MFGLRYRTPAEKLPPPSLTSYMVPMTAAGCRRVIRDPHVAGVRIQSCKANDRPRHVVVSLIEIWKRCGSVGGTHSGSFLNFLHDIAGRSAGHRLDHTDRASRGRFAAVQGHFSDECRQLAAGDPAGVVSASVSEPASRSSCGPATEHDTGCLLFVNPPAYNNPKTSPMRFEF